MVSYWWVKIETCCWLRGWSDFGGFTYKGAWSSNEVSVEVDVADSKMTVVVAGNTSETNV